MSDMSGMSLEANIGEMLAVAMAEGGQTIAQCACRFTNMTDACAIAGVKFPNKLDTEFHALARWLNEETKRLCQYWDETAEEARYCLVGEMLVKMQEGESADSVRAHLENKMMDMKKIVRTAKTHREDRFSDREGFDEDSIYLRENNWGDKRVYNARNDEDYWTRRDVG